MYGLKPSTFSSVELTFGDAHALGRRAPVAGDGELSQLIDAEVLEAARVLLEVEHLVAAEPPACVLAHAGHGRVDVDEAVGVRVRQRAQDDGVEHGEDRGGGAEA